MRAPVTIAARLTIAIALVPLVAHAGLSIRPTVNIFAADAFASEDPRAIGPGAPAATRNAVFMVSRSFSTFRSLKVPYAIRGTASNGADYLWLSGEITIPAGRRTASIILEPFEDPRPQASSETVVLTLRPARQYTLGSNAKAKVVIADYVRRDDSSGFVSPPILCPSCPPGYGSNQWWHIIR